MVRRLPFSLTRAAALTLGAGFAASTALFVGVSHLEYDNLALSFNQRAEQRVATVRQGLHDAVEVVTVTNQLFALGTPVTRAQFQDFTAPLLLRHPFIKAFNFHRVVKDGERAAVEAELQRLIPGTVISDDLAGRRAPAARRPAYSIVDYLVPLKGNEAAFGFDAATRPQINAALARAHAEKRAAATPLFPLVQDASPQPSFQVLLPVYDAGGQLAGDTAVVVRAEELVSMALAGAGLLDDAQIVMSVYAGARPEVGDLVFTTSRDGARPRRELLGSWIAPEHATQVARTLDVAGRPWLVEVSSRPRPFAADHLASLVMLAGGILLSMMTAAWVQASGARARRVQQLVRKRTADLKRTNRRLVDDMVARERTEKALQQSEQRFRQLVSMSSDWYWEQDSALRFTMITGGFSEKAGVLVEHLLGKTLWEYIPALGDTDTGRTHIAQLHAYQPFADFEYQILDDNGQTRWFLVNGQPVFDELGQFTGYRGTGSDITERKLTEQRVHHVAQHDTLTGLPNRSLLQDRLSQAVAYASRSGNPVWVMLIDLDRFKFVNDSMGHKAGDVLLMTVAARLRSSLRDADTVARLSGDEFVVIVSERGDQQLTPEIVQRVMNSVAQPVMLGTKEFFVTCSIGVAVYPSESTAADTLIEHADIAMYRAKKLGRNNFQFYTPAMNEESMERVRIESALRNAVERGEFVLYYQPQLDLKTGKVCGMEALIRWQHPELGMVPPSRFISIAEETGMIVAIGAWVLRTACAQNKAWRTPASTSCAWPSTCRRASSARPT